MWISRRWLEVGLAASLLLNVFLVGIEAGLVFIGHRGVRSAGGMSGPLLKPAHIRALPAEDKKIFDAAMDSHREAIRIARKQHRAARLAIEADIVASTFDRAKVASDFRALRDANGTVQEAVNNALIDSLANLSQQSRADLVGHDRPDRARATGTPP